MTNWDDKEQVKQYKKDYYLRNQDKFIKRSNLRYNKKKKEINEESSRKYYENDKNFSPERKEYRKSQVQKIKRLALSIIDPKLRCARCGCDDMRFLEKNHKNGGGNKEAKSRGRFTLSNYEIIKGIRKTDDLEILCKPCNHIHFLELKHNSKTGLETVWNKPNEKFQVLQIWESVAA